MQIAKDVIELKSHNSNYILNIFTNNYQEAINHIKLKFENEDILKDITINHINASLLDERHIDMIKQYLKDELDINYVQMKTVKKLSKTKKDIEPQRKTSNIDVKCTNDIVNYVKDSEDYKTKIVKHSLRSGSCINYDGNILVIGDVNAGAELIASGSIIVLGMLRGFASAGAKGNRDTMVIAYKIIATQLRISELIAIPPKDDHKEA